MHNAQFSHILGAILLLSLDIKGSGSRDNFFKAYTIESVLYDHAPLIFKFLECMVEEKNVHTDFACFSENPWNVPIPRSSEFQFGSSVIGQFSAVSTVHPSLDAGKIRINVHILRGFRFDISKRRVLGSKSQLQSS